MCWMWYMSTNDGTTFYLLMYISPGIILSLVVGIIVTAWAKTRHVHTQTENHFIAPAQNNYACSLPPLAKVDWSAFPECFLPTM